MQPNDIDWKKVYLQHDFSYKYYNRLTSNQKMLIDNSNLNLSQRRVAMQLHKSHPVSLRRAIKYTFTYWLNYIDWMTHRTFNKPYVKPHHKRITKELEWQGFVKKSKFKQYGSHEHSYITTNSNYKGEMMVFPEKFSGNYYIKVRDKLRDIHQAYDSIPGFPGYTKLEYAKKQVNQWNLP